MRNKGASGFSLVELMIALSIISVAMGMMAWNILYGPVQRDANEAEVKQLQVGMSGVIREANSRFGSLLLEESGHLPQALLEYGLTFQNSGESDAWGGGSKWYRVGNLKIDLPTGWDNRHNHGHNEPGFLALVRDNKNDQVLGTMVVNVKGDVRFIPNNACGAFEAPSGGGLVFGGPGGGGIVEGSLLGHPCLGDRPVEVEVAGRRGRPRQDMPDPPPATNPETTAVTLPDPARTLPEIPD